MPPPPVAEVLPLATEPALVEALLLVPPKALKTPSLLGPSRV
jgi:hypothetical protein